MLSTSFLIGVGLNKVRHVLSDIGLPCPLVFVYIVTSHVLRRQ